MEKTMVTDDQKPTPFYWIVLAASIAAAWNVNDPFFKPSRAEMIESAQEFCTAPNGDYRVKNLVRRDQDNFFLYDEKRQMVAALQLFVGDEHTQACKGIIQDSEIKWRPVNRPS